MESRLHFTGVRAAVGENGVASRNELAGTNAITSYTASMRARAVVAGSRTESTGGHRGDEVE